MMYKNIHPFIFIAAACCMMAASCAAPEGYFTESERILIRNAASRTGIEDMGRDAAVDSYPAGTMRVLMVNNEDDLKILRSVSRDFSKEALMDKDIAILASLMISTVTHPSQDGVGIAAPQVGLNRRMVAVQRFDMEGEPFKVYPNIRIIWKSDDTQVGPEGCLSVPDCRGNVERAAQIVIEYSDITGVVSDRKAARLFAGAAEGRHSGYTGKVTTARDTVSGFTAVIFQHEVDHLDGILYTDRLQQ